MKVVFAPCNYPSLYAFDLAQRWKRTEVTSQAACPCTLLETKGGCVANVTNAPERSRDDYVICLAYGPRRHLNCPNMMQGLATNVKWKIMHKNECKNLTLHEQSVTFVCQCTVIESLVKEK